MPPKQSVQSQVIISAMQRSVGYAGVFFPYLVMAGPYFAGEKKLMPKPTDLSYYNWETQASTHNSTPNFQVVADQEGLLFKNKRDRKVVNVDPAAPPGDNSSRNELECEDYLQVTIFDHLTRRKN